MKINMSLPVTYSRCQTIYKTRRGDFKPLGNNVTLHRYGDQFQIRHWSTTVLTCDADDTLTLLGADISVTTRKLLCQLTGLRMFVNSRIGAIDASVFVPHQGAVIAYRDGMQVKHGVILNPETGTYHIERCDRQVLALFQRTFKDDILKAKALDRLEAPLEPDGEAFTSIRFEGLDRFRNNWMRQNNGYKAVLIDPLKEGV